MDAGRHTGQAPLATTNLRDSCNSDHMDSIERRAPARAAMRSSAWFAAALLVLIDGAATRVARAETLYVVGDTLVGIGIESSYTAATVMDPNPLLTCPPGSTRASESAVSYLSIAGTDVVSVTVSLCDTYILSDLIAGLDWVHERTGSTTAARAADRVAITVPIDSGQKDAMGGPLANSVERFVRQGVIVSVIEGTWASLPRGTYTIPIEVPFANRTVAGAGPGGAGTASAPQQVLADIDTVTAALAERDDPRCDDGWRSVIAIAIATLVALAIVFGCLILALWCWYKRGRRGDDVGESRRDLGARPGGSDDGGNNRTVWNSAESGSGCDAVAASPRDLQTAYFGSPPPVPRDTVFHQTKAPELAFGSCQTIHECFTSEPETVTRSRRSGRRTPSVGKGGGDDLEAGGAHSGRARPDGPRSGRPLSRAASDRSLVDVVVRSMDSARDTPGANTLDRAIDRRPSSVDPPTASGNFSEESNILEWASDTERPHLRSRVSRAGADPWVHGPYSTNTLRYTITSRPTSPKTPNNASRSDPTNEVSRARDRARGMKTPGMKMPRVPSIEFGDGSTRWVRSPLDM